MAFHPACPRCGADYLDVTTGQDAVQVFVHGLIPPGATCDSERKVLTRTADAHPRTRAHLSGCAECQAVKRGRQRARLRLLPGNAREAINLRRKLRKEGS